MPTKERRISVLLERPTYETLQDISRAENDSLSHIVSKLVNYALELSEDLALVQLAENRLASFDREKALTSEDMIKWNRSRKKSR